MPSFLPLPSPSLLPATLIAITIALSTFALFVATIIIRCMLSLFVVAHCCAHVVTLSTLSRQPPLAFVNPITGWLLFAVSVAIAPVAVAHPPPSLPSLLPLLPSPSLSQPPSLPTPWPVLPLPSLLTGTLIAVTIALAILAIFVAVITLHCTLLLFVVAHHRGNVVALSTLSCQPLPSLLLLLVDCHDYPTLPNSRDPSVGGDKGDT
jgi:hypothetical protein